MQHCDGCFAARKSLNDAYQAFKNGDFSQSANDLKDGMTIAVEVAVAKPLTRAGIKFRDIIQNLKV